MPTPPAPTLSATANHNPVNSITVLSGPPAGITARGLFTLNRGTAAPHNELLRNRYLCRGGSLLLVGNTGIGKSSLTMQMMVRWALGQACFGIEPTRPLKSLLIQGENDEEDLAEMRDGVSGSLGLTEEQTALINGNVVVHQEDAVSGQTFVEDVMGPLLDRHQPDLVWLDPVFQYLDGDSTQQEAATEFLRKQLKPKLTQHNCAAVLVHHTTKPARGRSQNQSNPSLSAYDGAGSAEFGNWARAVLSLQTGTTPGDAFRLVAGKRGARLPWRLADGRTHSYTKLLRHSRQPGTIFWEEVAGAVAGGNPPAEVVAAQCPDPDALLLASLPAEGWVEKQALIANINRQHGIGLTRTRQGLASLVAAGQLVEQPLVRAGKKPGVNIGRALAAPPPQPAAALIQPAAHAQVPAAG